MAGSEAALTINSDTDSDASLANAETANDESGNSTHGAAATPPAVESSQSVFGVSSILNGVLIIAISLISGVIGAVVYERTQPPPPRIMVLDMSELLKPIANDPSLNALEKRRITEDIGTALEKAMQLEADSGAIVLDASVVLKAPGESYVQP